MHGKSIKIKIGIFWHWDVYSIPAFGSEWHAN
ncbi:MAG: alpha-L-fucosidase [Promethearchaeota archaeon]